MENSPPMFLKSMGVFCMGEKESERVLQPDIILLIRDWICDGVLLKKKQKGE